MACRAPPAGQGGQVMSEPARLIEPLEGRWLLSFAPVHVNFQPAGTPPDGFQSDDGSAYGPRSGGSAYGWVADNGAATVDPLARNSPTSPSKAYDTFAPI